jgi:hypothetical protein
MPAQCAEQQKSAGKALLAMGASTESAVTSLTSKLAKYEHSVTQHGGFVEDWASQYEQLVHSEQAKREVELDAQGDKLQQRVALAQEQTAQIATLQRKAVTQAMQEAKELLDSILDSQLRPCGDTPTQLVSSELAEVHGTREHARIVREVFARHLKGDGKWKEKIQELTKRMKELSAFAV